MPELEKEGNIATYWFRDNSMIVNPEKFQAIINDRKNQKVSPEWFFFRLWNPFEKKLTNALC